MATVSQHEWGQYQQSYPELLRKAETALIELTDRCSGSCYWGESSSCACHDVFWPAINRIRELRKAYVTGP